jgi:hypothetical protein
MRLPLMRESPGEGDARSASPVNDVVRLARDRRGVRRAAEAATERSSRLPFFDRRWKLGDITRVEKER